MKSTLNLMVAAALALGLIFAASPQARQWARHAWLDLQADVRLLLGGETNSGAPDSSGAAQGETGSDLTIGVGLGQQQPTPAP